MTLEITAEELRIMEEREPMVALAARLMVKRGKAKIIPAYVPVVGR